MDATDTKAAPDPQSFPESHHGPALERLSGGVPESVQFDWAGLYALLGEAEDLPETDREKLCQALRSVFEFVILNGGGVEGIGRRAVALSWVTNPALWDGKSIRQVARYLNCNPVVLRRHTAAARRRFGITHPGTAHAWNFKG
jgi:hypothetical protein